MKQGKESLGLVIDEKTHLFEAAKYAHNKHVEAEGNVFIEVYRLLGIGEPDNNTLKQVAANDISEIYMNYMNKAKAYSASMNMPEFFKTKYLQDADIAFKPLENQFKKFHDSIYKASCSLPGFNLQIALDDCSIVEGKIVLNEEALKRRFQTVIETTEQAEFYNALIEAKQKCEKVSAMAIKGGYNVKTNWVFGQHGFIYEVEDGRFEINPESIMFIK